MIEPLTFSNAFVQDTKEALGPNCIDFFRKYKKSNGILWFVACKQEQTASKYIRKIIDFLDTKTHLSEESKQTILENWYHLVNQCVQSEPKPVHQTTSIHCRSLMHTTNSISLKSYYHYSTNPLRPSSNLSL